MNTAILPPMPTEGIATMMTLDHRGYRTLVISAKDIGRIIGMTKLELLQAAGLNSKRYWIRGHSEPLFSVMGSIQIVKGRWKIDMIEHWLRSVSLYVPTSNQEEIYIGSVRLGIEAHIAQLAADLSHETYSDEESLSRSKNDYSSEWLKRQPATEHTALGLLLEYKDSGGKFGRERKPGFVYVLEYATGVVKIGKSQNPKKRLAHLQSMSPSPIVRKFISDRSDHYHAVERLSHKRFEEDRLHGEMFTVSFESAVDFIVKTFGGSHETQTGGAEP